MGEYPKAVQETLRLLRREKIEQPVIFVGAGTCGIAAGSNQTISAINEYLNENNIHAAVIEVGCIGLCSAEPIVDVQIPGKNRIAFGNITAGKVNNLLDAVFNNTLPDEGALYQYPGPNLVLWEAVPLQSEVPFFKNQKRVVLEQCGIIDPDNIEEYIARGGYRSFVKAIRNYTSLDICNLIDESGLKGRGGGGFPTGQKWKITYNTPSDQKYLICNADESDPGTFMDRALIEGDPHRLIEGMGIAAYAVGANQAYVYIRAEYPETMSTLEKAISQARDYGLIGANILDSGFSFYLNIRIGAGAFVCGEETALINSIEGKRGTPQPKPPHPAVKGLFGKPTVVNNVETLANVPAIVCNGPAWFNAMGTENSKGTKVFAVTGKARYTGLIEVAMGTTLKTIVYDIVGGIKDYKRFKAIQIGGPSGACLDESCLSICVDYEALRNEGAMMGSGGLVVMDETTCMVDVAKFFMNFLQNESCGKCIPCREGTRRMLEILESITRKPVDDAKHETLERFKGVMMLEELAEVIRDTSLCGLGQTAPNPVLSTLKYFREEYEEHIFDRKCRAGVCKGLRTYVIDTDRCTGCTICFRKCPVNAIIGTQRNPHFIVQDKCIGCGICYDFCKFNAINSK
ncbi:MAG: NADH dehydrogenase [Bacteroidetes bacterium GWE2_42_24]|nr:MAG: NADH dehydrogenase [Bacteroidetes bacterium GWE2_42_24]OFY32463.1 MAG: NADH dehydrogenase [Bacteroidetes bacterium GWF2_43_11]